MEYGGKHGTLVKGKRDINLFLFVNEVSGEQTVQGVDQTKAGVVSRCIKIQDGSLTWGGDCTIQGTDGVLWNCALESWMIL